MEQKGYNSQTVIYFSKITIRISILKTSEITEKYVHSDSARPKCSPDILSGQHSPCSDILRYFRTNDKSIISFKVYIWTYN